MDIHKNARLTPHSRAELVRRILCDGQTPKAVATVCKDLIQVAQRGDEISRRAHCWTFFWGFSGTA